MRTYYGSDKKRREDAKRKKMEEKRQKRLSKNAASKPESAPEPVASEEQGTKLEKPVEGEIIN